MHNFQKEIGLKKGYLLLATSIAVAGCGLGAHTNLNKKSPEVARGAEFSYEIASRELMSASDNDGYEVDGRMVELKRDQICVNLKSPNDLKKIKQTLGATVIEQEWVYKDEPVHSGSKKDGTFRSTIPQEKVYLPSYLLSVPSSVEEDISDLDELAVKTGAKGHYKFPSKRIAALYRKLLKVRDAHKSELVVASLNLVGHGLGTTTEGPPLGSSTNTSSPNTGDFWYAKDDYGDSNCRGADINDLTAEPDLRLDQTVGTGSGVKVCVIDSGFQGSTETYVPGQIISGFETVYDSVGEDGSIKGDVTVDNTTFWHGRRVAGFIFASFNDSAGIGGTAPGSTPYLCHTDYTNFNTKQCIDQARTWGCKVINMSFYLGYDADTTWMQPAINAAWGENRILVAAAGNDGNQTEYPAAYPGVIGVGAHNKTGGKAYFSGTSNYSNTWNVDIWAPGVDMAMPTGYGDYEYKYESGGWGTSFAAPLVSGAIAVAVQKGRCSNANTALDQLLQWSNSMTCGPALDAIWAGLGS